MEIILSLLGLIILGFLALYFFVKDTTVFHREGNPFERIKK